LLKYKWIISKNIANIKDKNGNPIFNGKSNPLNILTNFMESQVKQMKQPNNSNSNTNTNINANNKPNDDVLMKPWELEYNKFQHEEFYSQRHPCFGSYNKLFNLINYFDQNWIFSYNNFYFFHDNISRNIPNDIKNMKQKKLLNDVCENYMSSLNFCLDYYTSSITDTNNHSWNFYYRYRSSPTFSDLYNYLNSDHESNTSENINTTNITGIKEFISPLEQLMLILPKHYFYLIPESIRNKLLSMNLTCYPTTFPIDVVYGTKFIYSDPILPNIDDIPINVVTECYNNLTDIEKKRDFLETNHYEFVKRY